MADPIKLKVGDEVKEFASPEEVSEFFEQFQTEFREKTTGEIRQSVEEEVQTALAEEYKQEREFKSALAANPKFAAEWDKRWEETKGFTVDPTPPQEVQPPKSIRTEAEIQALLQDEDLPESVRKGVEKIATMVDSLLGMSAEGGASLKAMKEAQAQLDQRLLALVDSEAVSLASRQFEESMEKFQKDNTVPDNMMGEIRRRVMSRNCYVDEAVNVATEEYNALKAFAPPAASPAGAAPINPGSLPNPLPAPTGGSAPIGGAGGPSQPKDMEAWRETLSGSLKDIFTRMAARAG